MIKIVRKKKANLQPWPPIKSDERVEIKRPNIKF